MEDMKQSNLECANCGLKVDNGVPYSTLSRGTVRLISCTKPDCLKAVELSLVKPEEGSTLWQKIKASVAGDVQHRKKELEEAEATPPDKRTPRQIDLLKGVKLPASVLEIPVPKPTRTLADAWANVRSMVTANTAADWGVLYSAFEKGELEQFRPDKLASLEDQNDYLKRMRMVRDAYNEHKRLTTKPLQATQIEDFWETWTKEHSTKLPCGHFQAYHVSLDDMAWMSWKYGKPKLLCRQCGEYFDDPALIESIVKKMTERRKEQLS